MSDLEKCPCDCHESDGHFHCWTGVCCERPYAKGNIMRPVRVHKPYVPESNAFKTFSFPSINKPFPNLIGEELIGHLPMEKK